MKDKPPHDDDEDEMNMPIAGRRAMMKAPFTTPTTRDASLCEENREWLEESDYSLDTIVSIARIREENPEVWVELWRWTHGNRNHLRALRTLVERSPRVSYQTLADEADVSVRSAKKYVSQLSDKDVVETHLVNGVCNICFTSDDVELLARDVAHLG